MTASNGDPGAVVYGISTNALRDGEATTPSADAEGRVRLRNPAAVPVYEEQAPTIDSGAPHMVGPIVLRMREGKEGGGKGPLLSEDASLTLARANDQTVFAATVRRLTPIECERLQAFPDGWTCLCERSPECCFEEEACCPDGPRYAAMGNAVTVSQVERVLALVDEPLRALLGEGAAA